MGSGENFVLGVDFGSDSVRVLVVDAHDGSAAGSGVCSYSRWGMGAYCDPKENRFRQHPLDYIESLSEAAGKALTEAGAAAGKRVRGISVDTTGSTPCLADGRGVPLALTPGFEEDPDAMFVLWKDHTALDQARRINEAARSWGGADYTVYEGGIYSTEWYWAKALRLVEANPRVAEAARTIVEHCDWIPSILTGATSLADYRRSRCAAGHKALWHASWGGYPPQAFLEKLHPVLSRVQPSLGTETWTADTPFGRLCPEWAQKLGLPESVVVSVGAFDAHMGAVGGGVAPGTLVKIMGTSTCDITIGRKGPGAERLVPGICGQVDGSVVPGYIGYEAGQSAYGDLFAWFRDLLAWPYRFLSGRAAEDFESVSDEILPALEKAASALKPGSSGVVALDWINGRRTPDADQGLKAAVAGLSLGSDAPTVFLSLVEAAAFGSRAIVERLREGGVPVERVSAIGGVALKSDLVMRTLSDVLNMEIAVPDADQCVALGAAMFAAVAARLYPDVLTAQTAMGPATAQTYKPDRDRAVVYEKIYKKYRALGDFAEKEMK